MIVPPPSVSIEAKTFSKSLAFYVDKCFKAIYISSIDKTPSLLVSILLNNSPKSIISYSEHYEAI